MATAAVMPPAEVGKVSVDATKSGKEGIFGVAILLLRIDLLAYRAFLLTFASCVF